jgi:hypothetical protein
MFITDAFARILCKDCRKEVAVLIPGQQFEEIKQCDCKEVVKKPKRVTRKKAD